MDADVVVVGAGAAGLSAALSLARRSLRVVLLEARDRAGGRVWSRAVAGSPQPAELGAEFIHGPARETMRLLREARLGAVAINGEGWICDERGDLRRDDTDFASAAATVLAGAASLAKDESAERFLQRAERNGAPRETIESARAFVEGFEAADPAIASARAIAEELRSGADATSARPLGGYAPMFEHLLDASSAAGVKISFEALVRRISWHRGAVAVDVAGRRGDAHAVHARAAIVTLPLGVLKRRFDEGGVTFEPDLGAAKRDALAGIEMGHAARVVLWFRTAFWEQVRNGRYRDGAFFRGAGQAFTAYWTQMPIRSRLVVAWAGGPKATAMSGASNSDLIERARHGFGALLDAPALARSEFEGGATHDWTNDAFARGAYSYVVAGGGNARGALGAPVDDTLFFAGEATSVDGQGGTVNGAFETGERAAAEAAASLGISSDKGAARG